MLLDLLGRRSWEVTDVLTAPPHTAAPVGHQYYLSIPPGWRVGGCASRHATDVGRSGEPNVFVCPDGPDHPHRLSIQ
ncbi:MULTISPECIES: hypothetical protein [unclassified Streptomyces]|uniref:hypothetical protein n=1 Tax=unclassified Streptomyces TaxID=2593676 RepID=UPI0029A4BB51|nr:hypothetical protein [Streptomyces sp. DK15]MDX2391302.1 hypothetical protein [Streptomyces sp. DK15]